MAITITYSVPTLLADGNFYTTKTTQDTVKNTIKLVNERAHGFFSNGYFLSTVPGRPEEGSVEFTAYEPQVAKDDNIVYTYNTSLSSPSTIQEEGLYYTGYLSATEVLGQTVYKLIRDRARLPLTLPPLTATFNVDNPDLSAVHYDLQTVSGRVTFNTAVTGKALAATWAPLRATGYYTNGAFNVGEKIETTWNHPVRVKNRLVTDTNGSNYIFNGANDPVPADGMYLSWRSVSASLYSTAGIGRNTVNYVNIPDDVLPRVEWLREGLYQDGVKVSLTRTSPRTVPVTAQNPIPTGNNPSPTLYYSAVLNSSVPFNVPIPAEGMFAGGDIDPDSEGYFLNGVKENYRFSPLESINSPGWHYIVFNGTVMPAGGLWEDSGEYTATYLVSAPSQGNVITDQSIIEYLPDYINYYYSADTERFIVAERLYNLVFDATQTNLIGFYDNGIYSSGKKITLPPDLAIAAYLNHGLNPVLYTTNKVTSYQYSDQAKAEQITVPGSTVVVARKETTIPNAYHDPTNLDNPGPQLVIPVFIVESPIIITKGDWLNTLQEIPKR